MKLSSRSFPHPVVGNADDVPDAEFQATFDFGSDRTSFTIKVQIQCSSRTLLKMIAKGTACYTLHVECGNTLLRRSYDFTDLDYSVTIPATDLNDTVEVNAFVRAKKAVPAYAVEGAHEDYGDATFAIGSGDILAVGDSRAFEADNSNDPLRRVGALMEVRRSSKTGDHVMETDERDDKFAILLCEADFVAYDRLKNVSHLKDHLTNSLVLPALMEAITLLKGEEDADDIQGKKWARILRGRLDALELGASATALEKAQMLLDMPIRRAFRSAVEHLDKTGE